MLKFILFLLSVSYCYQFICVPKQSDPINSEFWTILSLIKQLNENSATNVDVLLTTQKLKYQQWLIMEPITNLLIENSQ